MIIDESINQVKNHLNSALIQALAMERKAVETHIEKAEKILSKLRRYIYDSLVTQEEIKAAENSDKYDCVLCEITFTGKPYIKNGQTISPDFCPNCLYIHAVIDNNKMADLKKNNEK
jgi:hypothetical protein